MISRIKYLFFLITSVTIFLQGCQAHLYKGVLSNDTSPGGAYTISEFASSEVGLCLCIAQNEYPLQFQAHNNSMMFIATMALSKGEAYTIKACSTTPTPLSVISHKDDGSFHIEGAHGKILSFVNEIRLPDSTAEYYGRDGFIHPFYSPDGVKLTEDYPRGHTHQHGIFHAWTRSLVNGQMIDFWNQHAQLGTVRLLNAQVAVTGPVFAILTAELEFLAYLDGDTISAARESWQLKVYQHNANRHMADLNIVHRPIVDSLVLTEYHYGGFGFRANDGWNLEGSERSPYDSIAYVRTSEGHDHTTANHTRPEWVTMWGEIEDKTAGLAVASHPTNFRHPQPVRVHPSMPYFTFAPMVLGQFVLTPDDIYEARYRIVTYDGTADDNMLNALTENFAGN